jgi:hypothetical protein
MYQTFSSFTLTVLLSISFSFSTWAGVSPFKKIKTNSLVEDSLAIQTIVFQTELYREYKKQIIESISVEEQRSQKIAEDWNENEWNEYIENIVKNELIFKVNNPTAKEKNNILNTLKAGLEDGVKGLLKSTVSLGRKSGVTSVIAYLGGTAAGYAIMGLGLAIGAPGIAGFFAVFPLGTIIASSVIAIQSINNKIEKKKAFNENEVFDYYAEYKSIIERIQKDLSIKDGDLLYSVNINQGIAIDEKKILKSLGELIGIGKSNVSLVNLRRSLKKNNLYSADFKLIFKARNISYYEKIISILYKINTDLNEDDKENVLIRFNRNRVYNLPVVKEIISVTDWGQGMTLINNLYDLPATLRQAPAGMGFVTILKVYKDFVLPKLSERLSGVHFKEFKCLRRKLWKHMAKGYKNTELVWDTSNNDTNVFIEQVNSCLI